MTRRDPFLSLRVFLVDMAASAALLALAAAATIIERRQTPEPTPTRPTVPTMPAQRTTSLFTISEDERTALVRARLSLELGIQPAPEVLDTIVAMHERAVRMELDQHADDFRMWEAGR